MAVAHREAAGEVPRAAEAALAVGEEEALAATEEASAVGVALGVSHGAAIGAEEEGGVGEASAGEANALAVLIPLLPLSLLCFPISRWLSVWPGYMMAFWTLSEFIFLVVSNSRASLPCSCSSV